MRILVITNLFPPVVVGGYELGCAQQIAHLRARGHEVEVLTGDWRRDEDPSNPAVHRVLPFAQQPRSLFRRVGDEFRAQHAARRVIRRFDPDVTYVFNPRGISRSALFAAQAHAPVAYFVSDPWLAREMLDDGWSGRWKQRLDAGPSLRTSTARVVSALLPPRFLRTRFGDLDLTYATFSSDAVRRQALGEGLPVADAPIIHCSVDTAEFPPRPPVETVERFLYVGQLMPHKGVRTALEAFLSLCDRHPARNLTLTLAGGTIRPDYEGELRRLAAGSPHAERVRWLGAVAKEEVGGLYASHDALVFPSEWDEPFSLVLMEAMASRLPVVATLTGGTPEIAVAEENLLAFDAGDPHRCREQMERLFDVDLANRLAAAARRTIEEGFTIEAMVDRVEAWLGRAARREDPRNGGPSRGETSGQSVGL